MLFVKPRDRGDILLKAVTENTLSTFVRQTSVRRCQPVFRRRTFGVLMSAHIVTPGNIIHTDMIKS
jgi:hypothetical protein